MRGIRVTAMVLVIIGALNWGLIGFFDYNLVADIFDRCGCGTSRVIYAIVGLAGLLAAYRFICKCCNQSCCSCCHGDCKCSNGNCSCAAPKSRRKK